MCLNKYNFVKEEDNYTVEDIKELIQENLFQCGEIRNFCKENNLLNEQWYIDWEISLNKYSVMDPND